MNLAKIMIPKVSTVFLRENQTVRQGWEVMHRHGYTAIPVVDGEGRYVGTVSEGDFLWRLLSEDGVRRCSMKDLEQLQIRDILRENTYPSVRITVTMDELLESAMNQNFIPVVDDAGSFIGIVTRKDIIRYFAEQDRQVETLLQIG